MTCSKLFPNLSKFIGAMCSSIPVMTTSVEKTMKLIKNQLRSTLNDINLSNSMKIALESPVEITDIHLKDIVDT